VRRGPDQGVGLHNQAESHRVGCKLRPVLAPPSPAREKVNRVGGRRPRWAGHNRHIPIMQMRARPPHDAVEGGTNMDFVRRPVPVKAALWDGSEGAQEELEKILGGPSKRVDKGVIAIAGMLIPFGLWIVKKQNGSVQAYTSYDFEARFMPASELKKAGT